jgi:uncharacterized protein YjbI with pentapeptide repeats
MSDAMGDETVSGNGEPGTQEAEALAAALNHSAERVQTLWFSFLTFMLYLAIAAGTTTHRMLFLESPLNLPVLNIPLPLLGFYVLTPIIFVVFHFYMLLNLVLLARTAKSFEDALVRALPEDGEARENFRMRIENTLFVQLLVGGRLEREGLNAWFLEVMAFITLALGPAVLLLMFEIMFLPYHSEWRTWLHRGVLALDLALVWTLWPAYRSGWGVLSWPKRRWWLVAPGVGSAAALAYAVVVAIFPDERMYLATNWLHGSAYWDPYGFTNWDPVADRLLSSHGRVPSSHGRPNRYRLDRAGQHFGPTWGRSDRRRKTETNHREKRYLDRRAEVGRHFVPRGRDLTGADLSSADVRHVDFSSAILNRANLGYAWAKKARFDQAQLQGAQLRNAQLQGALFLDAGLQGASLNGAQLEGASLDYARLQGASLYGAQLWRALLFEAQLQGAFLQWAELQGASLVGAQLPGASLSKAQLQGASLDQARLQGASLDHAQLQGASFVGVCAWRADSRRAAWKDTRVEPLKAGDSDVCDWTADSFAALKQLLADKVPEGDTRRAAMERIEQRLDPTKALKGEDEMAKVWADREHESPAPEAYEKSLAEQWREVGCAPEGAPYLLHALIIRLSHPSISPFRDQSDAAKSLASAFFDDAHCAGAHGLSEADKAKLKRIAAPERRVTALALVVRPARRSGAIKSRFCRYDGDAFTNPNHPSRS